MDLRVSVQTRGARDRVRGHLATGILADSPVVLVPNLPVRAVDSGHELEVLVIPVPPQTTALIERFIIRKLEVFTLRESPHRLEFAVLYLHGFSRYAAQLSECDPDELGPALEANGGDWWAALTALEIIPPGIEEIPDELLHKAGEVEREQYRPSRSSTESESYRDVVVDVCKVSCRCPSPPSGNGDAA
jgi:hypothetical protein